MDPYEEKLKQMQVYVEFLGKKIDFLKKEKSRITFPNKDEDSKLMGYQKMYRILTDPKKK